MYMHAYVRIMVAMPIPGCGVVQSYRFTVMVLCSNFINGFVQFIECTVKVLYSLQFLASCSSSIVQPK